MLRELELKFNLLDEKPFMESLNDKGILLSPPVAQQDVVFFRKGKGYSDLPNGEPIIRIRRQANTISTALKKYQNGFTDRLEVEFEVSDPVLFQTYLELLDIVPIVRVSKKRRRANYKEAIINLDHVNDLGVFAEIEIISEDNSVDRNIQKLYVIAEELGLNKNAIVDISYDQMLFYKMKRYQ